MLYSVPKEPTKFAINVYLSLVQTANKIRSLYECTGGQ